tara:strand:+ start:5212 stop:6084 length:873 start_codon:yes stop_codon:yes gene_type:complete
MAETGYTPIQLYRSSTAAATPSASDLADGELAINTNDGKLFFKNSGGAVTEIASTGGNTGTVSSVAFSTGSTGLSVSGSPITTSGTITLAGTLATANGGTGSTSTTYCNLTSNVTGTLPTANGGTGLTSFAAGTDYVAPGTATTFTAKQTLAGSTSSLSAVVKNMAEVTTVSATAATGTIDFDTSTQSVLYYTSNAAANFTVNFRCSSGTSLDTAMSTGETLTCAFMVTNGGTAYYNNAITVDGVSVTPKYQFGTAWSSGNTNSIDIYSYTIVKTGSAAFTVFTSQSKFA